MEFLCFTRANPLFSAFILSWGKGAELVFKEGLKQRGEGFLFSGSDHWIHCAEINRLGVCTLFNITHSFSSRFFFM